MISLLDCWRNEIWDFYPPSRCSLNIRSKARQSSKIVYNWACKDKIHSQFIKNIHACPDLTQKKSKYEWPTPASTAMGLPRWSISDSSSSMLLFIKEVILGIRALITASRCWNHRKIITLSELPAPSASIKKQKTQW